MLPLALAALLAPSALVAARPASFGRIGTPIHTRDTVGDKETVLLFDSLAYQGPDGTQLLAQEAYVHKTQIDIQDFLDDAADVLSSIGIHFGQDLANASERLKLFAAVDVADREINVVVVGLDTPVTVGPTDDDDDRGGPRDVRYRKYGPDFLGCAWIRAVDGANNTDERSLFVHKHPSLVPAQLHSDDDWPAPVAGIGKALREAQARVNYKMYEIPSTTSTTNPAEDAANAPSSGVSMTSAKPSSDQGSHMRNSSGPAAQISRASLFGVDAPVLGFTFDPVACHLQAVIAWLSPSDLDGHACHPVRTQDTRLSIPVSSTRRLNQPRDGQKTKVLRSESVMNYFISHTLTSFLRSSEKSVEDSRCIVEQGVDAAAAEDIQEKLIGPKDKVFQCAQPTKNGPDLPNEIQKDRLTTSAVWPNAMHLIPDSWPHRVRFQEIQELQLRLGGIKRMLDENDSTALHEFREELQVEQAMRVLNAEKMPQLLPIADEQLQSFKSIFSTLRRIADETREKISSGQVVNEAEYRHFWDRIITAVFCAKTLDDGTSIEAVNVLCDLTSGLEVPEFSYTVNKLSSKVFNASSKFPSIGDIVEPAGPSTSRRLGTLDAVLQDAYQRSSKAATSSLRSHVIAREGELIASAGRWAENTGNLPQLQARVVDYHDFSICDGAVAAVVPDVFSAKESEHAKMFSPLKGFCDKPSEKAKVVEPEQPPDLQAQSEDNLAVFARRPIPTPLEATRAAKAEIRARIGERAGVPVSQSDDAQLHGSRLRQDDTPTIRSKLAQAASTSAALSLALEPPVPSDASTQGAPELQVKASSTVAQQQNPGSSGQRARGVEISLHGVHNLNAAGIHDFPIFAIATVGAKGRLLAAWGEYVTISVGFEDRSVFVTRLADTNCPEWDISDRGELFRLALFLIHLRDIWSKRLVAKFDRRSFREEWTKMDFSKKKLSGRFAWRTADQKGEETYINLMQEIQRNMKDAEGRKKTLVEQVQKEKARATAEED
ncbi:hypothetical protein HDZ31DRAFT_71676 [Schizophyllum fasciatum]